jgi:diaminohydroxyphosphoribosylaminopyrimidine deaminase/5-amino-6-(5-phosphoribosylamino)uracil reductase
MQMALEIAARARGRTLPNPMVGAVVVRSGRVIARAWHSKAGRPHAEALALARAGAAAKGATLYISLEPCSHIGRTPPCTEAILKSGVRRVVAAMVDPDPRVRGRGLRRLRAAGVRTAVGLLEPQARALNEPFITRVGRGRPFVTVKIAQSLDGRIAPAAAHQRRGTSSTARRVPPRSPGGESRWISGPAARRWVHRLRSEQDAILVGVNTLLADNPRLTVRGKKGARDPVRVVLDSRLRTPSGARLFRSRVPVWIVTTPKASRRKELRLRAAGAEVIRLPARNGRVHFPAALKDLARRGISRLLVEGGGEVVASALQAQAVDRVVWIIAPKLFGGGCVPAVGGPGIRSLGRAVRLKNVQTRRLGEDWVMTGEIR